MFQVAERRRKRRELNKALKVECLLVCDINMQMDFTESIRTEGAQLTNSRDQEVFCA